MGWSHAELPVCLVTHAAISVIEAFDGTEHERRFTDTIVIKPRTTFLSNRTHAEGHLAPS